MGCTFDRLTKGNVFVWSEVRFFGRNDEMMHFSNITTFSLFKRKLKYWIKFGTEFKTLKIKIFEKIAYNVGRFFRTLRFTNILFVSPMQKVLYPQKLRAKFRAFKMAINFTILK